MACIGCFKFAFFIVTDYVTMLPFLFCFLTLPKLHEHLSTSTVEYWGKFRELVKSIMSLKFRTVICQKFVLTACCIIGDIH